MPTPPEDKGLAVEEEAELEQQESSFCGRRVVIDPAESPGKEPLGHQRTAVDEPSAPLRFWDDTDSRVEVHKVSDVQGGCGHREEGETDFPSTSSLSKWSQQLKLSRSGAGASYWSPKPGAGSLTLPLK